MKASIRTSPSHSVHLNAKLVWFVGWNAEVDEEGKRE